MADASSFSVYNPRQIIYNLSILIKNKCLFSVRFNDGKAFFLTALLEIDEDNRTIIFDSAPKDTVNQQLLKSSRVTFEADFAGIKASFKTDAPKHTLFHGESAFVIPIPESLYWMQRREFFRITSPRSKSSYCQIPLKDKEVVKLDLYDISLTGFSVLNTSESVANILVPGKQFDRSKLVLSGVGEDIIAFKVCAKFIINPEKIDSLKIQKIGCLFTRITPGFESIVQRYINQLQRESIQKSSEKD